MDLSDLGFKCGLEIHQRLNTRKLFCNCYCDPNKDEGNETLRVSRKLRAVVGETGKFDPAAAFEASRGKAYSYIIDDSHSCLVEADEEPPHSMNLDALQVALILSRMLGARPIDNIFIMRKTVIDGSAVSGFQRTAMISLDGQLPTSKGVVEIPTIALEEESAGIVEKSVNSAETTYRLDRLGIPLLEIATSPGLKDGEHAMETAEQIGQLLRSTGKVQRGLGSIRQDLNVSIARGARVEIKGVQELRLIPKMVENEVQRQIGLLKLQERLKERHLLLGPEHFSAKDITHIFNNSGCKMIKDAVKRGDKVYGMKLQSFGNLFKESLSSTLTFGAEVAGYVRAFTSAKGIIHTDEALEEKYGMGISEINAMEAEMNAKPGDLIVLCIGAGSLCLNALRVAFDRCIQVQMGVPEETRRAEGEISIFMRPLPGSARMYPETDLSPVKITPQMLSQAEKSLPEPVDKKKAKYLQWGLNAQIADQMIKSQDSEAFENLVSKYPKIAPIVANTYLETLVALKRLGEPVDRLSVEDVEEVLALYNEAKITKAGISDLLKLKAQYPEESAAGLAKQNNLLRLSDAELRLLISKIPGASEKKFAEIMKTHRLRVDAMQLKAILDGK